MTTTRIAVTGVDGTGKTTLVRKLAARFESSPGLARAFRAPQYHEDPDLPFFRLSSAIDALSVCADQNQQPLLKATALFLSMTLYGDVERHVLGTFRPKVLFTERQCLADSLAYSRFYLPFLNAPLDRDKLEPLIRKALFAEDWQRVEAWTGLFQQRLERFPQTGVANFWELPLYLRELFSLAPADLLEKLKALYHAEIPEKIILLTTSPEDLAAHLQEKKAGSEPQELHEQAHILSALQKGLEESCQFLRKAKPSLEVQILDSRGQTPEQTLEHLLQLSGV